MGDALRAGRIGIVTREDQQVILAQIRKVKPVLNRVVVVEAELEADRAAIAG